MLRSGCSNEPSFLGVNAVTVSYSLGVWSCTCKDISCIQSWKTHDKQIMCLLAHIKIFAFHHAQVGKIKAGCQWMKTNFVLMNMTQKQTAALIALTQHILPFYLLHHSQALKSSQEYNGLVQTFWIHGHVPRTKASMCFKSEQHHPKEINDDFLML